MFRKDISDNDINYKQSMKNVQSCHVIKFLTKIRFVPCWHFVAKQHSHGWGEMPPDLTKQFALKMYSKIRVQAVLA